jgi:uncharacterized delta-60 repeat protein
MNSHGRFVRKPNPQSRFSIITLLVMLVLAVCFGLIAYAAAGDPDESFTGDGRARTDFFGSYDEATDVIQQTDGKILAVGYANTRSTGADFALVRYNIDGSLDTSFSDDGKVNTDFGSSEFGLGVALQSDGKIVVCGLKVIDNKSNFAVARYNMDGTLDPTFGGDGKVTTDFFGEDDRGVSVDIQTDGKIVVVGAADRISQGGGLTSDFAVARYNTDGTLDQTFSQDGKVTTNILGQIDFAEDVRVLQSGKILVVGSCVSTETGSDFAMVRYNSDGSRDTSFSGDGKVNTDFNHGGEIAHALTIQEDQKIVLAGFTFDGHYHFAVARYNTDGSRDMTFDGDGRQTTSYPDPDWDIAGYAVGIQTDGKIVVMGRTREDTSDIVIVRYNTNGSPDTSFSKDGLVKKNFGSDESTTAGTLQSDDRIVVAGTSGPQRNMRRRYNFLVTRFQSADVTTTAPSSESATEGADGDQDSTSPARDLNSDMPEMMPEEYLVVGTRR